MSINPNAVEKLADYFTGAMVAASSVGLSVGGDRRVAAQQFFEVRESMGINGYASKDEAVVALTKALQI